MASRTQVSGFLVFLVIATGLFAGLHAYVGSRLFAGLSGALLASAWAGLWALLLALPLGPVLGRVAPPWLGGPVRFVGYTWMGTFGLLLTATVATDLVRLALPLLGIRALAAATWQPLAIAALALPAAAVALVVARTPARVVRVEIPVAGLGAELDGFTIAQVSDLHVGETLLSGRWLRALVARVNALGADAIAVTGDLIDGSVAKLRPHVAPLGDLKASSGVYFVTGNHEYYSDARAWVAEVRRLGLTVLLNEHRLVQRGESRLALGGIPDPTGRQFYPDHAPDAVQAFAGVPAGVPRLLLAHQPRQVTQAAEAGVQVQLSGHTHGGQLFPFMAFVRLQQPVVAGLRKLKGVWVYTHRGSGYWGPPMRLGAAAEIALLTLRRC